MGLGDKQSDSLDGKVAGQRKLHNRDSNLDEDVGSKEDVEEEQMWELKFATLDESGINRFKNWSRRITGIFQALFVVTRAEGESSESSENFESHFIEAKRFSTPGSIMLNWHNAILNLCCPDGEPQPQAMSRNVLEGWTKVVMSQKGKTRIGKGLGFNLCVAPRPTLSPYFGSGRLRSERRSTKTEAENFGGT